MTQYVDEHDVRKIAEYARIGLTDDEVVQMTIDLNSIIDGLQPITQYNLEGVKPTFHPIGGLSNVMREDVHEPGFTQQEALANAPQQQDGAFLIPSILVRKASNAKEEAQVVGEGEQNVQTSSEGEQSEQGEQKAQVADNDENAQSACEGGDCK